jgi:hypothetical protein
MTLEWSYELEWGVDRNWAGWVSCITLMKRSWSAHDTALIARVRTRTCSHTHTCSSCLHCIQRCSREKGKVQGRGTREYLFLKTWKFWSRSWCERRGEAKRLLCTRLLLRNTGTPVTTDQNRPSSLLSTGKRNLAHRRGLEDKTLLGLYSVITAFPSRVTSLHRFRVIKRFKRLYQDYSTLSVTLSSLSSLLCAGASEASTVPPAVSQKCIHLSH